MQLSGACSRPCGRTAAPGRRLGAPAAQCRWPGMARAAAAAPGQVESIQGVRPEIQEAIAAALGNCVTQTSLPLPNKRVGKVRDTYELDDKIVIVTTDRQSAFDRLLASIPFKGQVLNQTSAWWFAGTSHIVGNAVLDVPDPNITVMKKCTVFPVEFVVRGYMTGSTDTSLWTHYKAGARSYCGNAFPDGMAKNERLAANVITPTTKSETHDEPIAPADIVARGLMTASDWDAASAAALSLFAHGQATAAARGLLLVDTKYELGKDADGNILLLDEIHTPDSSRYWLADSYEARLAAGEEPQNIDKEFLRLWFRQRCDPYKDEVLPAAPPELVRELSSRYVYLYERITGQAFAPPPAGEPVAERMLRNMAAYL
ncbi:purC [Scenedesmus sp. PABB004]|nr:purC [Scenedesmus sp. PABB004]